MLCTLAWHTLCTKVVLENIEGEGGMGMIRLYLCTGPR